MKIYIVTDYLYPQINGIAYRIENYINIMREIGHNVCVFGPPNCKSSDNTVFGIQNWYNKDSYIGIFSFSLLYKIIFDKPDVIYYVFPPSLIFLSTCVLAKLFGIRIVCSNHVNLNKYNDSYHKNFLLHSFMFCIVSLFIMLPQFIFADKIIAPSRFNDFETLYNYKLDIMSTGINSKIFYYDKNIIKQKKSLLYVGRIADEKNLYNMLNFFKIIQNDYKLKIIGDGPLKNNLIEYIYKNNIIGVEFLGKIDHNILYKYYNEASIFVTFSLSETFGFTLLESLSCGTPIIYPKCGVFCELYDNKFIKCSFDVCNQNEFKNALFEASQIDHQTCIDFASKYSWYNATTHLIDNYFINNKK